METLRGFPCLPALWLRQAKLASANARISCLLAGLDLLLRNAHAVERTVHEYEGNQQEAGRERALEAAVVELHRQLDREEAEQGGELDDRVHGHRRGVLEGVADG